MSLEWTDRAAFVAGRRTTLVLGSFQTVSSSERRPAATSTIPALAFGAAFAESDGFLRSQSTMMTFFPLRPITCARVAATVDLPSLGSDDVMPIILFDVIAGSRSIASFIE